MAVLQLKNAEGYLHFDEANCREEGRRRATAYQNAQPFPHIVIDDFLDPDMLRGIHAEYPSIEDQQFFDREQERFKFQFGPTAALGGRTRNILSELNSQAFLGFLEEMTGIGGLISDPYLSGGGLHLTRRGGHLGVHADFNVHGEMKVERRLNLLVYLNEDWQDDYNGKLELWDTEMKGCEVSVAPLLGRAVVFSTTLDSYHGHPDALACPPERDRRSIATYYYTAFPEGLGSVPNRTTVFQPRPNTTDRTDWRVKVDHVIGDWVPPRLQRYARKLNRFG